MSGYEAYPKYRNSEQNWLGLIPHTWDVLDGKRAFKNRRESPAEADVQLSASQKYGVVPQAAMMAMEQSKVMLALKGTAGFRHVERDDFVISLRSFEGGIEHSLYDGCVSPAYTVLAAQDTVYPSYFRYLFKSSPYISALQATTDSLRDGKSITYEQFGSIGLSIPSTDEQQKIANFLDHETAKIDTLIEKQQQLIKLLKEKRQAVISHAVTKGLNPDASMKDSRVEWLGEVPAHWDVMRVKQIAFFITSGPRGWSDFIVDDAENIFLQSGDLNDQLGLKLEGAKRVAPPIGAEGVRTKVEIGDVVVCITGANTGRVAVVSVLPLTTYINQHLSLIRPFASKIQSSFLGSFLSSISIRAYFDVTQYGLKEGLSLSNVAETPVVVPPMDEQKAIVDQVNAYATIFDRVSSNASVQINLLQERRTALISAAVTGKIDVRNWQAPESTSNPSMDA